MDKYVLVPQDRYDTMLKKEKDSVSASTSNKNHATPPPPGIPATDYRTKQALSVSDEEADEITRALVESSIDNHKSHNPESHLPLQSDNSNWRDFWQSQK